jgi:hypothetical protein
MLDAAFAVAPPLLQAQGLQDVCVMLNGVANLKYKKPKPFLEQLAEICLLQMPTASPRVSSCSDFLRGPALVAFHISTALDSSTCFGLGIQRPLSLPCGVFTCILLADT